VGCILSTCCMHGRFIQYHHFFKSFDDRCHRGGCTTTMVAGARPAIDDPEFGGSATLILSLRFAAFPAELPGQNRGIARLDAPFREHITTMLVQESTCRNYLPLLHNTTSSSRTKLLFGCRRLPYTCCMPCN
jgi:hypothetical protein